MHDKIRLAWKSINRTRLWLLLAAVLVIILAVVLVVNWERREVRKVRIAIGDFLFLDAPHRLLAGVIRDPGNDAQLCYVPCPDDGYVSLTGPVTEYIQISSDNFRLLRASRSAVVQAISDDLRRWRDQAGPVAAPRFKFGPVARPDLSNVLYYNLKIPDDGFASPDPGILWAYAAIIHDLNAVEVMPLLPTLENVLQEELRTTLVMSILLQEKYAPAVDFAKAHRWVDAGSPEEVARHIESIRQMGIDKQYLEAYGPSSNWAYPPSLVLSVELTDEVRAKLRGWTEDFLKTRPPSTWLRERGMSPVVYAR